MNAEQVKAMVKEKAEALAKRLEQAQDRYWRDEEEAKEAEKQAADARLQLGWSKSQMDEVAKEYSDTMAILSALGEKL